MRIIVFITIVVLFTSCNSKCPCSSKELKLFDNELEGHHLKYIEDDEIACEKVEDYWFIKWDTLGVESNKEWDLIVDSQEMSNAGSMTNYGITGKDVPRIRPFIRKVRANGYDIGYISSIGKFDSKYSFLILGKNKGFMVAQTYDFKNGKWLKISNDKVWQENGESFDINNL